MLKHSFSCLCGLAILAASSFIQAAVVLQYHHVDEQTPPSTSISPELFERHLEFIEDNDYEVWDLPKITDYLKAGKALPDKIVAISFDDAFLSIYDNAYPLLKTRKWPFTVFVSTQPIEQRSSKYMTWPQLKEIGRNGATIANHTHTHTHLVRRLDGEQKRQWFNRVRNEIETAETIIEQKLGSVSKLFAYPFGEFTNDIQSLLDDMGYVAFGQQSGAVGLNISLTALPRFPMTNRFGAMSQFKTKLASLPYPMKSMEPSVEILEEDELENGLVIDFLDARSRTQCFFEGQAIAIEQTEARINIASVPNFSPGRARINCTAPSDKAGRFYWFSHTWMKKKPDGSWYQER